MKTTRTSFNAELLLCTLLAFLLLPATLAHAAGGTWTSDNDGNWSDTTRWLGGVVADDSDSVARFTNDVTAIRTVTIDTSVRTNGSLVFGDGDTNSPGGWIVAGNQLVLNNTTATTPIITVDPIENGTGNATNDVQIRSVITGGQGYIKKGAGVLTLVAANTISNVAGPYVVQIDEGAICLANQAGIAPRSLPLAFNGGTLIMRPGGNNFNNTNYILTTGTVVETNIPIGDMSGYVIGSPGTTLNFVLPNNVVAPNGFVTTGTSNQLMGFNGTVNVSAGPIEAGTFFAWRVNPAANPYYGASNAVFNILGTDDIRIRTRGTANQTIYWGALNGGSRVSLQGSFQADVITTHRIGDKSVPSLFSGSIQNGSTAARVTALFKAGTSTLTLDGTNTYTGATTIGNGKLVLTANGSIATTPSISLAATTAVLDVSAYAGLWTNGTGQILAGFGSATGGVTVVSGYIAPGIGTNIGRLTFENDLLVSGTVTNSFKTGFGATNDSVLVKGNLSLVDVTTVEVIPPAGASLIPNGTYPLVKWNGTLSGDLSNLTLTYPAQVIGATLALQTNLVTKTISLVVSNNSAGALTWRGDSSATWNHTTPNWRTSGGAATIFSELDSVLFDDSGSNGAPIDVSETVTPSAVTVNNTNRNYTFSGTGKITGVTGLTKGGSGKLTVLEDNDFSGSVTVNGGTIQIGNGATAGSIGGGSLMNNGTVILNRDTEITFTTPLQGSGTLIQDSTNGTLVLTGDSTHNGGMLVKAGTLQLGDGLNNVAHGTVTTTITNNATLRYFYNADASLLNGLAGNGVINYDKNAANNRTYTFPLGVTNGGFTGTINIAGAVRLHADTGNAGFQLGNGNQVNVPSGAQAWLDTSATNYTQSFAIAGLGWSGDTTPASSPGLGALRVFNCTVTGPITLTDNARIGGTSSGATIQGQISGGFALEIWGTAANVDQFVLTLAPAAPNAFGSTIITRGVLQAGTTNALTNAVTMTAESRLRLNGNNISIASLTGGTPENGTNCLVWNNHATNAALLTVGTDGTSTTFDGIFGNGNVQPLGLTKVGAGTLTLTGISSNTGPVSVNGGSLLLTGDGSFSNSTVLAVASGATLDVLSRNDGTLFLNNGQTLKGNGTVSGVVSALPGSVVSPGSSVGTLNVSGNVTLAGTLLMELNRTNTPSNCDHLTSSGAITYGGTLSVTNIGPGLAVNNTFQLFPSGVSGFSAVNIATTDANGFVYTWQNNISTLGSIKVLSVSGGVNTNPTNITFQVSGGNLTLSWPADHTGWTLQSQTNAINVGLRTNWAVVTGSSSTNQVTIPINTANGTVFFRLVYP